MKMKKFLMFACAIAAVGFAGEKSLTVEAAGLTQSQNVETIHYEVATEEDIQLLAQIFDYEYYMEQNPDVVEVLGDDYDTLFEHFYKCGIFEGRTCNANFDPSAYASAYSDLRELYGDNILKYYEHYITWGESENRTLTTVEACADAGITVTSVADNTISIAPEVYNFAKNYGFNDYVSLQYAINLLKTSSGSSSSNSSSSSASNSSVFIKPAFGTGDYWVVKNYEEAYSEARGLEKIGEITVIDDNLNKITYYIYKDTSGVAVYDGNTSDATIVYSTDTYSSTSTIENSTYVGEFTVAVNDTDIKERQEDIVESWSEHIGETLHAVYEYNGDIPTDQIEVYTYADNDEADSISLQPTTQIGTNYVAYKTTIDGVYTDTEAGTYREIEESDGIAESDLVRGGWTYLDEQNDTSYDITLGLEDNGDTINVLVGVSNTESEFGLVTEYDFPVSNDTESTEEE